MTIVLSVFGGFVEPFLERASTIKSKNVQKYRLFSKRYWPTRPSRSPKSSTPIRAESDRVLRVSVLEGPVCKIRKP
jgi:hypothetical protein